MRKIFSGGKIHDSHGDSTMTSRTDEPGFLDDDGPSEDLPAFISTTNAGELYGLREGESVVDAIARSKGSTPSPRPA